MYSEQELGVSACVSVCGQASTLLSGGDLVTKGEASRRKT
jgi:hypothetical protein